MCLRYECRITGFGESCNPPCDSLKTVQEVCQCLLILFFSLEGPKTYGAGERPYRGRSAALSSTVPLLHQVSNVGIGLSHDGWLVDLLILRHPERILGALCASGQTVTLLLTNSFQVCSSSIPSSMSKISPGAS